MPQDHAAHLLAVIQALEAQRALLGDAAVETAIAALRAQLPGGEAPPPASPAPFTGERKLVTVMFADISGFTALSERLDPEEVRALMNACFDRLVPIIHQYEGTIDKFIGDEIMALFGAPVAHERHAELACRAALEMMEALRAFNRDKRTALEMHIGLNTGLVIAGGIGSEGRQQYSVMGDAVNLAARLKDAARAGEIFVGASTQRLAGSRFGFSTLPPMTLKGKAEAVSVYQLLEKKQESGDLSGPGQLRAPLVGRESELHALHEALQTLREGRGGRLAVLGEAGIGKSRLVSEALQTMNGHLLRAEGRALSYTRQNSFQPAVEILRNLIGAAADSPAGYTRTRLEAELHAVCGEEGTALFPYLGNLLQVPLTSTEEASIRHLSPPVQRERLFAAFRQYVEGKARQQPLALVWEDLHWADSSTLLLIERLLALCDRTPLLLILLARPQVDEAIWDLHRTALDTYGDRYRTLALDGLPAASCSTLMRHLLDCDGFDPAVEEIIFSRAEGNPFFVEELLRSLLDQGLLVTENRRIRAAGELQNLSLPGTLQGVIAMRIDRLDGADKTTLQTASVLGRIFGIPLLKPLLQRVDAGIDPDHSLRQLLQRDLLRRRDTVGNGLEEFIFKHALTHEVAYHSLLFADRRRLHRLAGETIEAAAEGSPEDWASTLAYHFESAEESEKAVHYLRRAADRAKRLYANDEALTFYQRAIGQVDLLKRQEPGGSWAEPMANLIESQGDILQLTGRYEAAADKFRESRKYSPPDEGVAAARIHRKTGMCFLALSQFDHVLKYLEGAKDELLKTGDSRPAAWWQEWIELHIDLAHTYYWLNRPDVMMSMAEAVKAEIDTHGTPAQQVRFGINLTSLYFRQERFRTSERTVENARRQVGIAARTGNLAILGVATFFHSFSLLWHNDVAGALRLQEEGLALTEKTGDIVWRTRFLTYLSVSYRRLGQVDPADQYARRGLETAQTAKMNEYIGLGYANLAWVAWKRHRLDEVESLAHLADEYAARVPGDHGGVVFLWISAWPLAAACFEQDNLAGCVSQLAAVIEPHRKQLEPELETQVVQVLQAFRAGDEAPVRRELEQAFSLARSFLYL